MCDIFKEIFYHDDEHRKKYRKNKLIEVKWNEVSFIFRYSKNVYFWGWQFHLEVYF
jgi:hypothetical protein